MASKQHKSARQLHSLWFWVIAFAVIIITLALVFTVSHSVNTRLRANFLTQAQLVASSLDLTKIKTLKGQASDIKLPYYQKLKAQLMNIRVANKDIRFLYLMGQRKDKKVFFFSDSQVKNSKNYAAPGLLYSEASAEYLTAFKLKKATVTGEINDRWGKVVTALVPINDPDSQQLIAMLGMDMRSFTFYSLVITSNLLPTGLTLLTMILIFVITIQARKAKKLKHQLGIDPLTALCNRSNILETAESEISRLIDIGDTLSTIAVDIDNFKDINDCYGHQYGDSVLQKVSSCLKNTVRKTDHVGRIGGEEFMILLPSTSKTQAIDVAEKLRRAIESLEINDKQSRPVHVSASFGVSENWENNTDFSELLNHADQALYISKNEGRNQVNAYGR